MRFIIPSPSSGQMDMNHGNPHAIPAMAAYESWKPMLDMSVGIKVRCIMRLDAMVVFRSDFLCSSLAASPVMMNMRARVIDAPAPVAKEYAAHVVMQIAERIDAAFG